MVIELTYEKIMAILGLFTAACVAGGWMLKIIKATKKPSDDINERLKTVDLKLDNDNRRIKKLEEELEYISSAITMLMRSNMAIIDHLQTNNATGEMEKVRGDVNEFLLNRR